MNKTTLTGELKLSRVKRPQDQIADYLREEIFNGNLKPGVQLPTTHELAAQWQTHATTVQRAIGPLAKEGFLVRRAGVGTFVREREEKLTCVGVYGTTNIKGSPYAQAVRAALSRELDLAGIEMDLWMDPRPPDQFGEPWKPVVKAAENRQFQAFIATETNRPSIQWQQKLPIPVAFLGAHSVPSNVAPDMRQFVEISLRELVRQGCRSVGLIAPLLDASDGHHPEGFGVVVLGMLSHFTDVARELGLTVKNDWMRVVPHHSVEVRGQEYFGYEEFLKLWSQPEKPEGLIVFSDIVARGVILAIREKQVRVPEDLKLALHKNESIDLFCPMPATFVVLSERETARALIEQIQKQFRGESCELISLPFKIEAHK